MAMPGPGALTVTAGRLWRRMLAETRCSGLAAWRALVRMMNGDDLQTLTLEYLATVLLVLAVGLVFYLVPSARVRFRDVWVGAVLTGVEFTAAHARVRRGPPAPLPSCSSTWDG